MRARELHPFSLNLHHHLSLGEPLTQLKAIKLYFMESLMMAAVWGGHKHCSLFSPGSLWLLPYTQSGLKRKKREQAYFKP